MYNFIEKRWKPQRILTLLNVFYNTIFKQAIQSDREITRVQKENRESEIQKLVVSFNGSKNRNK